MPTLKSITLFVACTLAGTGTLAALDLGAYPALEPVLARLVDQGHDRTRLEALFREVELKPRVVELMTRPYEAKPWYVYRERVVSEQRLRDGLAFWREHAEVLARAEAQFGVPAELIVATLGIETSYGRQTGGFRVIDALTTLALEYPRRSEEFLRYLEEFLVLTREQGLDPLEVTGSYAGAIGIPQFMPTSYRAYAIDFDADGHSDLVGSVADAIGSVANYYRVHGWDHGQPVGVEARLERAAAERLVTTRRATTHTLGQLQDTGVRVDSEALPETPAALIRLEGREGPLYRVVFDNFFVITRYNTSHKYAVAVQLLGEQLRQAYTSL